MTGNFLTALSAAAFAAFILFLSILFAASAKDVRTLRDGSFASGLFSLAAFYFIPIGSLPPFIDFEYGGFCAAALLFLSSILNACRGYSGCSFVYAAAFPAVFCASWAALAFLAYRTGVPGALGSLGTYSAMPLWEATGGTARAGMILLIAALLCSTAISPRVSGSAAQKAEAVEGSLLALLFSAFITALFLPWNFPKFAGFFGEQVFFVDFIFFWVKCATVWLTMRCVRRFADCAAGFRAGVLSLIFTICGAGCLVAEALGFFR